MKCDKCGTEYTVVGQYDGDRVSPWHTHTAEKCRDALSAQLASMTKRAEEAADALGEARADVDMLHTSLDAMKAKLASMTKRAEEAEIDRSNFIEARDTARVLLKEAVAEKQAAEAKLAAAERERHGLMCEREAVVNQQAAARSDERGQYRKRVRDLLERALKKRGWTQGYGNLFEHVCSVFEDAETAIAAQHAAEAKLATAVEGLSCLARITWHDGTSDFDRGVRETTANVVKRARDTLRALGIDTEGRRINDKGG